MITQTLGEVTLFLEGTLAGVFVGSAMMEHAARNLSAEAWISYNRAKDSVYGPAMPVFFGVTLVASIVVTAIGGGRALQIAAALALFVAGIITVRIHLPLNSSFGTWSSAEHPADWSEQRGIWRRWNLVRTICSLSALQAEPTAFHDKENGPPFSRART